VPINLLHYFFNKLVVTIGEITILIGYTVWTNLNFFDNKPVWLVVLKSILCIILNYLLFNEVALWMQHYIAH